MNEKAISPGPAPLLTVRQVAERLAISSTAVYALKSSGTIPFLRIGGAIRFESAAVEEYLEFCRKQGRQEVAATVAFQHAGKQRPVRLHKGAGYELLRAGGYDG